jgi:peptide deformylase
MYGDPISVEGSEMLARALQHETDHLDGILFIDRLSKEDRKSAMKEIRESEWFGLSDEAGAKLDIRISPHYTYGKGL